MASGTQSPKPLLVTAAIIRDPTQDLYLIARRRLNDRFEAGKWEFPGGKVEYGETPETCLAREIKEELDLEIRVGEIFAVASHVYKATDSGSDLHVVLLCYHCQAINGPEARGLAVEEFCWLPLSELNQFDFAAADVPVVEKLTDLRS